MSDSHKTDPDHRSGWRTFSRGTVPLADDERDRWTASTDDVISGVDRYVIEGELGRGGMGEVLLARDRYLDRLVALKRIPRSSDREGGTDADRLASVGLLHEASLQAKLEHPAFVPVFDFGTLPDGSQFFTMARVDGDTVAELIAAARRTENPTRIKGRLLRAFAQFCHAIAQAHSAGIVHGDLKPTNLMLGRHEQPYVLDLGIASQLRSSDSAEGERAARFLAGGTPGYGPPEQFGGSSPDPRWDVYALGAVLFEIVTLEPLHRDEARGEDVASWYVAAGTSPRARRPDLAIAPELDSICSRALQADPADRESSVRSMAEAIDAFLDGQRDHEERSAIAQRYVDEALEEHARALDPAYSVRAIELWRHALSLLAQALALVPAHAGANRAMRTIAGRAPSQMDAEVNSRVETWTHTHLRASLRSAAVAYATWLGCPLVMVAMGVRDVWTFSGIVAFGAATIAWSQWASRRTTIGAIHYTTMATLSAITLWLSARWFGPFVVTAGALIANALAYGMMPTRRVRAAALWVTLVAMLGSALTDRWSDDPMVVIEGDTIRIHTGLTGFPSDLTWWAITLLSMATAVMGFVAVGSSARSLVDTTRREYREHWLLAAFAPGAANVTDPPTRTDATGPATVPPPTLR